mgnify:CR=1 FL=1
MKKAFNFTERPTLNEVDEFVENWHDGELDLSGLKTLSKKNGEWVQQTNYQDQPIVRLPDQSYGFKDSVGLRLVFNDKYVVQNVAEKGGCEEGSEYYYVMSIHKKGQKQHKTYWKHYGYYASHDGGYLENVCEVKPRETKVTVWDNA